MPYKDSEKRKQATRDSMRKTRGSQGLHPTGSHLRDSQDRGSPNPWDNPDVYAKVYPGMKAEDIALEEEKWRKVNERGHLEPEELKLILQWGIDTGQIRPRDDVALEYNLTQPEPRYGPQGLTKVEVRDKINAELKAKKIPTEVFFLGADAPSNHSQVRYNYSKDWYK